jgi:DNA-binding MltR family transcriptional regulator
MSTTFKKPKLYGDSFNSFMNEFINESDRAAVILGAAMVENLLGQILDKFLLSSTSTTDDLLEGDAPLATFSAKIKACHRLGLVDDQFIKLLNVFRRLRNGFAHEVSTGSLTSGATRDRVAALAAPFVDARVFQSLANKIAELSKREVNDAGVIFRAVLAVFHLELVRILGATKPVMPTYSKGIVENCMAAIPPEDRARPEATSE